MWGLGSEWGSFKRGGGVGEVGGYWLDFLSRGDALGELVGGEGRGEWEGKGEGEVMGRGCVGGGWGDWRWGGKGRVGGRVGGWRMGVLEGWRREGG